jgi:UDP-N-acetylmuramoyl-L-alanyl-D-glutamate--2,6-diaminopimelate ligase
MKFLDTLGDLAGRSAVSGGNPEITGVEYDSRRVRPGNVFVAMRGGTTDGSRFIDAAVGNGAVAVVTDSPEAKPREGVAWAQVEHGRRALAVTSANFYAHPERKLRLTGITGTNGKTTTSFLLDAILRAAGRKTLLVGTIEYHVADEIFPAPHTTPESLELHRMMHKAAEVGATEAVMEASSHALAQERVYGLPYDVAVFTNLTRDHLDYHTDMDDYFAAKRVLFTGCGAPPPNTAVINTDDPWGSKLAQFCRERGTNVIAYGLFSGDVRPLEIHLGQQGTTFRLQAPQGLENIETTLIGRVNVYNILAAAAAAMARGCRLDEIAAGVRSLESVPGRFQSVNCGQPFTVAVDYAHTDDAIKNLMVVAREFVGRHAGGRIITLFGCGGDRDRKKRPLMGQFAGSGSDFVILTSDNPRSEDPMAIIREAQVGVERSGVLHVVEPDRRKAIVRAIGEAKPGDIVLIAGKGHEKVQVLKSGPVPFNDVEEARQALAALGYTDATVKAAK